MTMIRVCDKCGMVIPSGDVSYRVKVEERRPSFAGVDTVDMPMWDYCAQCMQGISRAMERVQ